MEVLSMEVLSMRSWRDFPCELRGDGDGGVANSLAVDPASRVSLNLLLPLFHLSLLKQTRCGGCSAKRSPRYRARY
jgi:hypothetical protein